MGFLFLKSTMYAIVDIETTGGHAAGNDITEIAIVVHDGHSIVDRFESLVRPLTPIPYYIQVLTGINHDMVSKAPTFDSIAPKVAKILQDKIFIAHNVNFDYSFVKHHLGLHGYDLNAKKLCTVRLSRKVFPGLPSYSLGNLCRSLEIPLQNRHRAGGDAEATALLFQKMLSSDGMMHIEKFLKKNSKEQCLPPNLPAEQVSNLPYSPGVYYFHDAAGKVIYVGKAKNIKYRVCSHFTHNGTGRQRQEFLRNIHSISYQECGTELMAFILENIEIQRIWPRYNTSQKRFVPKYGIYSYEDRAGYTRLTIEKQRKNLPPIYTFNLIHEGKNLLKKLYDTHEIETAKVEEEPVIYNTRINSAIEYLQKELPSFAVVDKCFAEDRQSIILVERGRFYGMGYIPSDAAVYSMEECKSYLTPYPDNDYIRGLIYTHVSNYPGKKLILGS
jgi:DNA polymerase III subunit epsilon